MKNAKRKLELYEQLFRTFGPKESRCQVSQLASLWCVSERYVFTLLKTMEDIGWVQWQGQSGRNKKARLTCCVEPIDACYALCHNLAESGQVDELIKLLAFGGRDAGQELQSFLSDTNRSGKREVYIPFHRELEPLHPQRVLRRTERFLITQIYQRLTKIINNEVVGDLAYHWQSNNSGTEWYFQIRNDVYFHHGHKLVAQDAVRCLTSVIQNARWAGGYRHIKNINAPSEDSIEISLHHADWHLPRLLANVESSIFKSSSTQLVGSGAFSLDVFSTHMMRLSRYARYSDQNPILDKVEVWFYPDWASSKVCAHNQVRLQMPENTKTLHSDHHSTFLLVQNPTAESQTRPIYVEDTSESRRLFEQLIGDDRQALYLEYGNYSMIHGDTLCSVIEENDSFSSWMSFFSTFSFEQLGLNEEVTSYITAELNNIRKENVLANAQSLLSQLRSWLIEKGIIKELKTEPFQLEISDRLKGCTVNGFGWCELNSLLIADR
ncbi:SgrR family transcriptional regulator [Vibrio atypicus]|uniref:SgrR family transcriptional regulator n=1 Tax=Vibrio atypicus TaxID=558271 RepID=UPI001357CF63|nr:SgrR family transcriptional regulator [Vibrio atypicus]